jgi:hypothetical protein
MDFDYKSISCAQKLSDLQNYYQTSVAFSQALGITRMTLILLIFGKKIDWHHSQSILS